MKRLGLVLFALALLVGCGSGSSSGSGSSPTIDGDWSGVLLYSDATTAYAFTTSFKQSSGSTVTVTHFSFTAAPPCVESAESETAELDGGFKNNSSFGMSISTGPPNQLGISLTGEVLNNTITGEYLGRDLSGFCHASGQFTMTRM